jgi:hypothetical protein
VWRTSSQRAKLAPARSGLLPPQPGDDQNRRLARVVGQLGQAVSSYTLRKYGAGGGDLAQPCWGSWSIEQSNDHSARVRVRPGRQNHCLESMRGG